MSENKMPNLPPHLQEKAVKSARPSELTHPLRAIGHIEGYQQAYSDILQELGPVVEAVDKLINKENESVHLGITGRLLFEAEQALKHLKERVLNDTK